MKLDPATEALRLGAGEFLPAQESLSHAFGRWVFMTSALERYPDMLAELATEVYPVLYFALETCPSLSEFIAAEPSVGQAIMDPVYDALQAWLTSWHLLDEWCIHFFASLLFVWLGEARPSFRAKLSAHALLMYGLCPSYKPRQCYRECGACVCEREREPFDFHHPGWNPTRATWAETESAIRADFEKRLAEYREQQMAKMREHGAMPTPVKRGVDHFLWLADYQVGEKSFRAIARDVKRDRVSVTEAIKGTATLIGLTLREPGDVAA